MASSLLLLLLLLSQGRILNNVLASVESKDTPGESNLK